MLTARGTVVPVKICGLTSLDDARRAWDLGAAALGFVFHPTSPRAITVDQVARIREALPSEACCVGVFVDGETQALADAVRHAGLQVLQVHRRTPRVSSEALGLPLIQLLGAEDEATLESHPADLLLLDAVHPTLVGGTGCTADWTLAARMARRRPLMLAGGLNPENVFQAYQAVRPAALDVSSGVEAFPGRKDPMRLQALFSALSDGRRMS